MPNHIKYYKSIDLLAIKKSICNITVNDNETEGVHIRTGVYRNDNFIILYGYQQ